MRINVCVCTAVLVVALVMSSVAAWGQGKYTAGELDELLGPIALYPDPLLAQILPASTYYDQLTAASRFTGPASSIDTQPWDVSVKAVAHYPDVLGMMVNNPDWTIAIGQAYVNQPADVLKSIQRLRAKAELNGYLTSNAQQQVTTANGVISILPAQPQYIYVPVYNPQVVYVEPAPEYGISPWITFGAGLLIGAWLNNDIDWYHHDIYYHGWHGGGWVGHSRPYVNEHNNHYVNNQWSNRRPPVNRNINRHNIGPYRSQVQRNVGRYAPPGRAGTYPSPGARPGVPGARPTQPGRPGYPGGYRPGVPGGPGAQPGAGPGVGRPRMPRVPSARPGYPGTRPGGPGYGPGQPTPRPGGPGYGPSRPGTRPGGPGYKPSPPAGRPGGPGSVPRQSTIRRPTGPMNRPSAPSGGYRRSAPSGRPSGPSARPSGPSARPSGPSARPSGPSARPGGGGGGPRGGGGGHGGGHGGGGRGR